MKRPLITLLILIILISQTGCWNRKELNDLSIVLALGLDESPQGITVTAQVVNPGQTAPTQSGGGGEERSPVTTFQTTGKTLFEAMRKIQLKIPRKIYAAYLEMIVIGEGLAKKGFQDYMDFLLRDHELRSDFFFVIAKNHQASEILNVLTPLDKIPTRKLSNALRVSNRVWGTTTTKNLHQLLGEILNQGKEATISSVRIQGDSNEQEGSMIENIERTDPKSSLVYDEIGVFQKDRLVGWLNQEEGRGFNYTQGEIQSTIENIPCQENQFIGIEIKKTEAELTSQVVNNRPHGVVTIRANGNLGDVECMIEPINQSTIEKMEKQVEQKIEKMVLRSIQKAQSLQADIFGFGEALRRSDPQAWKKFRDDWNKYFINLPVQVTVHFEIKGSGFITKPLK